MVDWSVVISPMIDGFKKTLIIGRGPHVVQIIELSKVVDDLSKQILVFIHTANSETFSKFLEPN